MKYDQFFITRINETINKKNDDYSINLENSVSIFDYGSYNIVNDKRVQEIWNLVYSDPDEAKKIFNEEEQRLYDMSKKDFKSLLYFDNLKATVLVNQKNIQDITDGLVLLSHLLSNPDLDPIVRSRIGVQISNFIAGTNNKDLRRLVFDTDLLRDIKVTDSEFDDLALFDEKVYGVYPLARASYRLANLRAYYLYVDYQKKQVQSQDLNTRVREIKEYISIGDKDFERMLSPNETDNVFVPNALSQKGMAIAILTKMGQANVDEFEGAFEKAILFIENTNKLTSYQKVFVKSLIYGTYANMLASNGQKEDAIRVSSYLVDEGSSMSKIDDVFVVMKNILSSQPDESFYKQGIFELIKIQPKIGDRISTI